MPSGVPITLQTFAVALCGYVLGYKRGLLSVVIYLLPGIIGLPVFAGMTAGADKLVGFTGGFLYGNARRVVTEYRRRTMKSPSYKIS